MQTFRHWSRATALAVVVLIVANRPTAAQSLASASVASVRHSWREISVGICISRSYAACPKNLSVHTFAESM